MPIRMKISSPSFFRDGAQSSCVCEKHCIFAKVSSLSTELAFNIHQQHITFRGPRRDGRGPAGNMSRTKRLIEAAKHQQGGEASSTGDCANSTPRTDIYYLDPWIKVKYICAHTFNLAFKI